MCVFRAHEATQAVESRMRLKLHTPPQVSASPQPTEAPSKHDKCGTVKRKQFTNQQRTYDIVPPKCYDRPSRKKKISTKQGMLSPIDP